MDDKDKKISKPGIPPLPPGMMKPNLPPMLGGKPSLSPVQPSFGAFPSPGMPQMPFANQFSQPQQPQSSQAARDAAAEESQRMKDDKDKLEKKITDMEKLLSQEKEKALLATLKNQQDEALSSRVESSLKDIQDKMRRDRRDHEVEEERLTLRGKIKELETRLSQERETWMHTLKEQMSERETQGRDVEGHFIYRLQEMERRWLDEKAQWQKEISSREETIRSLKTASERLREVEDEFRKVSLEKSMTEREASKLRDDVARAEREKASIESYIKMIPEKEREIADLRSENIMLRGREEMTNSAVRSREEAARLEALHRDEKYNSEMGRLQAELGSISDRKNAEKNEELKTVQARYEGELQEKEKSIADISGEKIRAVSELLKIKGFVSRVQAINAVLDKERGQLKLEKMQLAQNMAAQLEEIRRQRQELDSLKAAHQRELEAQAVAFKAAIARVKDGYGAEMDHKHAEDLAAAARTRQEELERISTAHQLELSKTASSYQAEIARISNLSQEEAAKSAAAHQAEMSRIAAEGQGKVEECVSQMRIRLEASAEEEKNALRRQLEAEHEAQLKEAKAAADASMDSIAKLEVENRRLRAVAADFDMTMAARTKESGERMARLEEDMRRQDAQLAAASAQKAEAESLARDAGKYARDAADEYQKISSEHASIREQYAALAAQKAAADADIAKLAETLRAQGEDLRTGSENRARSESELLFLKQKIQQMEYQAQETAAALEAERAAAQAARDAAAEQKARDTAGMAELSGALARYKALEASFPERLKWAIKGKKQS